jgi:hypothetical protein
VKTAWAEERIPPGQVWQLTQWVVADGVGLGLCAGAGELLAVADGLDVALPDGVGVALLGPGEGVAVAEAVGAAPPFAGPADEVAVAITIPATIATTPVMTPTASSTRVQVEAGAVPDVGPLPVNGMPLWAGWTWRRAAPAATPGARVSGVPGQAQQTMS